MPPKKRTDQSKQTPPASPTISTSHTSTDTRHRLRHTGQSISTRSSIGAAPFKHPPAPAHLGPASEGTPAQESPREKKSPEEIFPPGARAPLSRVLSICFILLLVLFGWYIYGMVVLLQRLREDVGWWGIVKGDLRGMQEWGWHQPARQGDALEGSLNALADALGISPVRVASAVKPLIPQASLASMAAKSGATGGSEAVRLLLEDTKQNDREGVDTARIAREFAEGMGGDAADENVAEGGVI